MTRTKPVTPDEVRISIHHEILTLPADVVNAELQLIPGLLDPLMAELQRRHVARQARLDPELRQLLMEVGEFGMGSEPRLPDLELWEKDGERELLWWELAPCRVCGREHYFLQVTRAGGHPRVAICSDACVRKEQRAAWTERNNARSLAREQERDDRCWECGEVMDAQRSTKRYCSTRCRVAAFRRP